MSGKNGEQVQADIIAYLKSNTAVTNLLTSSNEIKETQWQGTDFDYPAVRASVDYMPSLNGCGVDKADIYIEVFSEQKSSMQASSISSVISNLFHKHPFRGPVSNGRYSTVVVRKVSRPERSIYAWVSRVDISVEVA